MLTAFVGAFCKERPVNLTMQSMNEETVLEILDVTSPLQRKCLVQLIYDVPVLFHLFLPRLWLLRLRRMLIGCRATREPTQCLKNVYSKNVVVHTEFFRMMARVLRARPGKFTGIPAARSRRRPAY